jgi:hypothetical protein
MQTFAGPATCCEHEAVDQIGRCPIHPKGAPGGSRQTWETVGSFDDTEIVVIDGTWPLPPRDL